MFDGFEVSPVDTDETTIFIRHKGNGPPLLLLRGFPETHVMWHAVARLDASRMTPVPNARRDLFEAMKQIAETGHGPKEQVPSMGCSIKWRH